MLAREMKGQGDPWAGALEDYFTAMRAAQRAAGTIRLHRHYLSNLREMYPRGPWPMTKRKLQRFLGANPEWKAETRKSARTVVCGFYRWAHGVALIDDDPAFELAPVKVPPGLPRPTPEHIVAQLVRNPDPRLGLMAMLAAYLGLRVSEIARVHTSDYVNGILFVTGKGGKVRGIPVVSERLDFELLNHEEGWLFPNGFGTHLSAGHVSKLLSHAMPDGWTGHTLRHRMATVSLEATHDLLALKEVLGHAQLSTTERYTKLPNDATRKLVAAASLDSPTPRAGAATNSEELTELVAKLIELGLVKVPDHLLAMAS